MWMRLTVACTWSMERMHLAWTMKRIAPYIYALTEELRFMMPVDPHASFVWRPCCWEMLPQASAWIWPCFQLGGIQHFILGCTTICHIVARRTARSTSRFGMCDQFILQRPTIAVNVWKRWWKTWVPKRLMLLWYWDTLPPSSAKSSRSMNCISIGFLEDMISSDRGFVFANVVQYENVCWFVFLQQRPLLFILVSSPFGAKVAWIVDMLTHTPPVWKRPIMSLLLGYSGILWAYFLSLMISDQVWKSGWVNSNLLLPSSGFGRDVGLQNLCWDSDQSRCQYITDCLGCEHEYSYPRVPWRFSGVERGERCDKVWKKHGGKRMNCQVSTDKTPHLRLLETLEN